MIKLKLKIPESVKLSDYLDGEILPKQKEIENLNASKKIKDRKIKDVLESVGIWRKLYGGIKEEDGIVKKFPLDHGALLLRISKKSLDDYLSQIRYNSNFILAKISSLGNKFGFNFNEHMNETVGVLRNYVKKHRDKYEPFGL